MSISTFSAFDKAKSGLWTSLQAHLTKIYSAEKAFIKSVAFADSFPFSTESIGIDLLDEYWNQWKSLRDFYSDETAQLDTLVKAIRTKGYAEDEKKHLYLLILGYTDILSSVVRLLDTHRPNTPLKDEELRETEEKFGRLQKFIRLNIKGIPGLSFGNAI